MSNLIKVIYNDNDEKFQLSEDALYYYNNKRDLSGLQPVKITNEIKRHDMLLIETIEHLGSKALNQKVAPKIAIVETEDYVIINYNQKEIIVENPNLIVDRLFLKIKQNYYNSDDCNKYLSLINKIVSKY